MFMKKLIQRLLSGFVALALVCMCMPVAFAAETSSDMINVTIVAHRTGDTPGNTADEFDQFIADSGLPIEQDYAPGSTFTLPNVSTEDWQGADAEFAFTGLDVIAYPSDKNDPDFTDGYTLEPNADGSYTVPADKALDYIMVTYNWKSTKKTPQAIVTNVVNSLTRTVAQNDAALDAKQQFGFDIYKVEQDENNMKNGLTLTYDATMDMTELGSSFFGDRSWTTLQNHKDEILDKTWIDLHFQFDSKINVSKVDLSQADLQSDMFTELMGEDGTWYTIDTSKNELILHCRWSSESAMANEDLDPMIYLYNVKVSLPSDWGKDDNGDPVDTIVINNHGYVDGEVWAHLTNATNDEKAPIDGGSKNDQFVLTVSDKVSLPGLDKQVKTEGNDKWAESDTADAGDTVHFKLTSNIPENLADMIEYSSSDEVLKPEISTNSLGDATGTYVLTIHDQMDSHFENPTNFTVSLVKEDGELTSLTDSYYTIKQSDLEHNYCTFEITINLAQLYNDDIIDESDFGATSIVVTYDATLSKEVTAGTYENTAWVTAPDWESSHDTVDVDTYQIRVYKYETDHINAKPLAGAEFELYQKNGDKIIESSIIKLISGEDGYAISSALEAGTYYLKETKAPEGYVCSDQEVEIVIPDQANGSNIVTVNFANSPITSTGGAGTMFYTFGGLAIVVAAGAVFLISRKSRKQNA